jgi:signal transduction histidine kinase
LEVTHDADQPDAWADAGLLGRAFINVVENAVHAMPGTGTLRVQVGHDAGMVTLVVADTGVGMDAASMARIFEPYFSTRATGSGLGLSIARRNLERLGGSITVTSAPGEGTTVTLRVPEAGDR